MTKISPLRALLLFMSFGMPLAASCARESNSFEPGAGAGQSGSKASGGNKATAGTTGSAFGGANTQGGVVGAGASAGSASAGSGAHDPEGGETGKSGSGGSGGLPPDVLMRASAVVYYQTMVTAPSVMRIEMKLNIKNQAPDPLPMTRVSIRYWFTAEAAPSLHNYYAGMSVSPVKTVFVDAGADSYALMTFVGAGTIEPQETDLNKSEIQLVIDNNARSFNQSNDHSWEASAATSMPNPNITMYLDDQLIWGCEPTGKCFDVGDGGQGGQGGQDGQGGQGGQGGQAPSGQAGEPGQDTGGQGGAAAP